MSRLILHRALGSPPARAVLMLADILDLKVDIREVNIVKMEHKKPEFLKLNPMGTVPVLEDGDFVLSESHAIMKYLVQQYGGARGEQLYPRAARAAALVDQCCYFDAGVFFVAFREAAFSIFFAGATEPAPAARAKIESSYDVLETYLQRNPYLAAARLTLADLSAGSTITAMQCLHQLDKDKYPRCADWVTRLEQESFFQNINKEGAAYFAKLVKLFQDRNKLANAQ